MVILFFTSGDKQAQTNNEGKGKWI